LKGPKIAKKKRVTYIATILKGGLASTGGDRKKKPLNFRRKRGTITNPSTIPQKKR